MTTADRRSVEEWEQLLLDMNDAYEERNNFNYDDEEEENDVDYVWLPLENDDDMILLAQALRNLHTRDLVTFPELFIEIFPGLTERGAHFLAEGLCQSESDHVHVRADAGGDDNTVAVAIVRILYLEGNQPFFETDCERIDFAIYCLQLQRNEISLTDCDLQLYCIDGSNGVLFGNGLRNNSSLKYLKLSGCGQENVTTESARAVAEGIRLSKIRRLGFGFDKDGNEELLRILCEEGIKASRRLFEVKGRVSHAVELANVITSLKTLSIKSQSSLSYSANDMVPLNIGLFNEGLRQTSSLVSLKLSNCVVGVEGMKNVSLALRGNRSIRILSFPHNYISDEGVMEFVRNWRDDSRLRSLQLDYNDFGPEGLRQLLPAVANHRAMHELTLRQCHNVGLLGLQLIGNEMHNMTLSGLNFSFCFEAKVLTGEESEDAIEAYELEQAKTRQCVVDGLKSNFYLRAMPLDNDGFFDNVTSEIWFYLYLNCCGRKILANGCALPPTFWCYVLAKCSWQRYQTHSHSLIFYFLLEQPMLFSGFSGMNRKRSRVLLDNMTRGHGMP